MFDKILIFCRKLSGKIRETKQKKPKSFQNYKNKEKNLLN